MLWECVFLHLRTVCMAGWTGRFRCGSCGCWDSGLWPVSSLGPLSDSASYSGSLQQGSAEAD